MTVILMGASAEISDNSTIGANNIAMCKRTAVTTGTMAEFKVKVSDTCNVKCGIYADSAGEPGALLGSNQTGKLCVVGWNTITLEGVHIQKDVIYWLAINSDQSFVRTAAGSLVIRYKSLTYADAWPNPAGTGYTDPGAFEYALAGWGHLPAGGSFLYNFI